MNMTGLSVSFLKQQFSDLATHIPHNLTETQLVENYRSQLIVCYYSTFFPSSFPLPWTPDPTLDMPLRRQNSLIVRLILNCPALFCSRQRASRTQSCPEGI